jgi:hypothetical protein
MFLRTATLVLTALTVALWYPAPSADAGERWKSRHRIVKKIDVRNHIRIVDRSKTVVNIDRRTNRGDRARQVNVYTGVDGYHRRGVGTWTYGAGALTSLPAAAIASGVKVIDVDKAGVDGHCSMEMGVCVIRP